MSRPRRCWLLIDAFGFVLSSPGGGYVINAPALIANDNGQRWGRR